MEAGCDPRSVKPGDLLEDSISERLEESQKCHECFLKGLSLASRAEQSAAMVAAKLSVRGYRRSYVESAVARLVAQGFIDDRRFAAAYAALRCATKAEGPASLLAGLRQKGLSAEDAEEAVAEAFPEEMRRDRLADSARRLTKKGMKGEKLYLRLRKLGFRRTEILEAGLDPPEDEIPL